MHQRRPLWYTGFHVGMELALWFQGRNLLELGTGDALYDNHQHTTIDGGT